MSLRDCFFELHSQGAPIQNGDWSITPVSRALVVQIPGLSGGWVWNRPAFVRVSHPSRTERILPVRDETRLIILGMAGLALAGVLLARILIRKD